MEQNVITSPLKAIRAKCLDCCCGQSPEVGQCTSSQCPLWAFRYGKNPYHKRVMSEEQRAAASERMKRVREQQLKSSLEN